MNRTSRFVRTPLPFFLALATVVATAACGSKASSPLGPTAVGATATIRGTVETGVTASAGQHSGGAASGIRVSVVGTTLAATTDDHGQFVLDSVPPSGAVTLRFEGPGLDARLGLSGLTPGQVLTISVQVSGNHVVLAGSDDPSPSSTPSPEPSPSSSPNPGHDHGEVEFKGTVQSVNAPDLMVDGRLVHTDASTEIKSQGNVVAVAAIPVGSTVEVKGTQQADGSVLAQRIQVEDNSGNDDDNGDDGDNNGNNNGNSGGNGGGDDGGGHN